jgi:sec-independent protein translocase protein TatB
MFDVGFSELVVIALVALVVIGPEKIPTVARTLGALVRRMRSYIASVQGEIEREMQLSELNQLQQSMQAPSAHASIASAQMLAKQLAKATKVNKTKAAKLASNQRLSVGSKANAVKREKSIAKKMPSQKIVKAKMGQAE